jgi:flagellin
MAMNAYRNYNINTSALSKNLEKLSSGYKINRAGDDAAGLAISEKMRAQITGLNAAQKNVKDGISLVKTAEGAMQEIQDMLNRMDYLATQSANGTYQNEVDREALQDEVNALLSEIDRIADSANFNGIKLLNGEREGAATDASAALTNAVTVTKINDHKEAEASQKMEFTLDLSSLKVQNTSTADQAVTITFNGMTFTATVSAGETLTADKLSFGTATQVSIGGATFNVTVSGSKLIFKQDKDPTTSAITINSPTVTVAGADMSSNYGESIKVHVDKRPIAGGLTQQAQGSFTLTTDMVKDGSQIKIGDQTYTFKVGPDSKVSGKNVVDLSKLKPGADGNLSADDLKKAAAELSGAANGKGMFIVTNDNNSNTISITERVDSDAYKKWDLEGANSTGAADATWKDVVSWASKEDIAAAASSGGGLTLQIGDDAESYNRLTISIKSMKTDSLGVDGLSIANPDDAAAAIQTVKDAINTVSAVRGELGAYQNRLEHTQNNLSVMAENIQDAESTIRDTDVAEEMMSYVKNNILVQSAQAMLAQANQVPQGVLQLLG